jgi:phosphoenolpyruvate phosphomutase
VSTIIWANHSLRASINAMREVTRQIFEEQSVVGIEGRIATMRDVFELAGNAELSEAERRYLPSQDRGVGAVILAASRGSALGPLTENRPKCMIEIRGQPLLRRLVGTLRDGGIREITVVRGYRKEVVDIPSVVTIDNDDYATTGEAISLQCAAEKIAGRCLIAYGDILFRRYILDLLLGAEGDIVIAADALWRDRAGETAGRVRDLVKASRPFTPRFLDDGPVVLRRMGSDLAPAQADAEWVGLAALSPNGSELVRAELDAMRVDGTLSSAGLPDLFTRIAGRGHPVNVFYVAGHWLDVDDAFDLAKARDFL